MRLKFILAAISLVPLLAAASQPVRLQPSTPWDVDYSENSCRLLRAFGDGKTKTGLVFESGAPDEMDMLVVGNPLASSREKVSATFLPMESKPIEGDVVENGPDHTPGVVWPQVWLLPDDALARLEKKRDERRSKPGVRPPPLDLNEEETFIQERKQFAAEVRELEIGPHLGHPVILETGSLGEALRAFDKCNHDSLRAWGVNPDLEEKIVRPVWPNNPTLWFSSSDYPADMAARGEESQVTIRLLVDANGKVSHCTSISNFKEAEFNKVTCALVMKRASFAPAELADGTKVPSYYIRRVIFRLEN
jgi:hypothetical protein